MKQYLSAAEAADAAGRATDRSTDSADGVKPTGYDADRALAVEAQLARRDSGRLPVLSPDDDER